MFNDWGFVTLSERETIFSLHWVFVAARGLLVATAAGCYLVAVCGVLTAVLSLAAKLGL